MDWKGVGQVVGGSAPLIGKLLGVGIGFIPGIGPIAGPIIGPAIGSILAREFDVPATPDAVAGAIASNPDEVVKAKLQAATDQIKAQYDWAAKVETGELHLEEVAIEQANSTMQAELVHQSLFFTGWRPFIGWVFGVVALAFGLMLTAATARAAWLSPDPLKTLSDSWPIFTAYFGVLGAAVGVLIKGRSDEKKAAIENGAAMPNAKPPAPIQIVKKK
jgi:Holin of 3TMs, for gene-transfer release